MLSTKRKKKKGVTKLKAATKLLIAGKKAKKVKKVVKKKSIKKKDKQSTPEAVIDEPAEENEEEDGCSYSSDDNLDESEELAESSIGHTMLALPAKAKQTPAASAPASKPPIAPPIAPSVASSKKDVKRSKPAHPDGNRQELETKRSTLREGFSEGPFFHKKGRTRQDLVDRRNALRTEWEQSYSDLTATSVQAHSMAFSQQPSPIVAHLTFASPGEREQRTRTGDIGQSETPRKIDALGLMEQEVDADTQQDTQQDIYDTQEGMYGRAHAVDTRGAVDNDGGAMGSATSNGLRSEHQQQQQQQQQQQHQPSSQPRSSPRSPQQPSHQSRHPATAHSIRSFDTHSYSMPARVPVRVPASSGGSLAEGPGTMVHNALEKHQRQLERIRLDHIEHQATKDKLRAEQRIRNAEGAAVELEHVSTKTAELQAELDDQRTRYEQLVAWCEQQEDTRKQREAECERMRLQVEELGGLLEASSSAGDAAVRDLGQARQELAQERSNSARWEEKAEALETAQDKRGDEQV
jgi:hypothetical protein